MTYCLALKVDAGLVALADSRVTSGSELSTAGKISMHDAGDAWFFVMTSGLRSLRDKTVTHLDHALRTGEDRCPSLLDAVGAYGTALRRTAEEDRAALEVSAPDFNLHALVGGQLRDDPEPQVFPICPEGNRIAINRRTPYLGIGATAYGKPILDRALHHDTAIRTALKLAFLSFDSTRFSSADSTRFSSADVGYPIDIMTCTTAAPQWRQTCYEQGDLNAEARWWSEHPTGLATQMPDGPWVETLLPPRPRAVGEP